MMKKINKLFVNRQLREGLAIALCTGIAFCIAFQLNLFNGLQLLAGDILFKTPSVTQQHSESKIVIIGIDEKSLEQLGRFTLWPRSHYAHLIDTLVDSKARLIVFDIIFPEPDTDDEEVAASMRAAGNVILPVVYIPKESNSASINKLADTDSFILPAHLLAENAVALGLANIDPDEDGTVRRISVAASDSKTTEPALALSTAAKYLRRSTILEQPVQDGILPFSGRSIPVNDKNETIINYSTHWQGTQGEAFPIVSFIDVINGKTDTALFEDKIVFIGATASGLGDTFWTPLGRMLTGVEIHAFATQTILANDFITQSSPNITIACILLFACICGLIMLRIRPVYTPLLSLLACFFYFIAVTVFFNRGIMLNMFYPPVTIFGTFLSINIYNAAWERSRRNKVTKTFGRYVSTPVADKILAALEQGDLKMGGEEQEITVAFADVRGFTGIANTMKSEELVNALNKYLSVVIQAVIEHQGIINKFGGDSIMAVWNAPTSCPDHPILAIKAALEAHRAVRELQQKEISLPKMDFGIGINTGRALAGNLGCHDRLEYSVIGSTVNSASRITSSTPGGKVWIGDSTFKLVRDYIVATPLGKLVILGKQERFSAFEVISICQAPISNKQSPKAAPHGRRIERYA